MAFASFNLPSPVFPFSYGKPKMLYISPIDIRNAMSWGSQGEMTQGEMTVSQEGSSFSLYKFSKGEGKFIYARQSVMLVPVDRLYHMSYGSETTSPAKDYVGNCRWCVIINMYPPGKDSMVTMIYPTGGKRMAARKITELASSLWDAYYGHADIRRKVAGEMLMGTENLCTRYDPTAVPRGQMPPALAEIREKKISYAVKCIERTLMDKNLTYLINDTGDIILHLWWLTDNGSGATCE